LQEGIGNQMSQETMRKAPGRLVGAVLAFFVLTTLALGAWWGFPVQDDTYMIRLLRLGGPDLISREHADRPVSGLLIASFARLAGEHRAPYVALTLALWSLLAAQAARLWTRLFPVWAEAWPAVALGVVAPVVTIVQYTSVSTLAPCVVPVVLVLAALLFLLGRGDAGSNAIARIVAALLAAAGATISQYALATAVAAAVLLVLLRRWRDAVPLLAGTALGFAVFRTIGDVTLRKATNPAVQLSALAAHAWSISFRIPAAVWECLVGAWGRAASDFRFEYGSKSTLVAAAAALAVAACAACLRVDRAAANRSEPAGRPLVAVVGAVAAGLAPAVIIQGWPLSLVYETRFFLPALPFATCATLALLLTFARPRYAALAVFVMAFLAADRLVLRSFDEKRLQADLDRFGERMRPVVETAPGLVVLVSPDRTGISEEEQMAKATYRWSLPLSSKFWMLRPAGARLLFGPRSGCPSLASLKLVREIRWPRADDSIRAVLWDASASVDPDPEPYFQGCTDR
jgi:hypothetical protein